MSSHLTEFPEAGQNFDDDFAISKKDGYESRYVVGGGWEPLVN